MWKKNSSECQLELHGEIYFELNIIIIKGFLRFPKSKFNEKCQESKLVGMATYLNKVLL